MIDALYSSTKATFSRLIKSSCVSEKCAKFQKLTTWLHMFIKSCLMPDAKIKVEYVNQSPGNLCPLSQTCFHILLLCRKYASFYETKMNLTTCLRRKDIWQVNDNFIVREYSYVYMR